MTRKPAPAADPRPMPPRPATGGSFAFDPVAWAYVRDPASVEPARESPGEPPVEPAVQPDLKEG